MLPTGTAVLEDSAPRPPHPHMVSYSSSVLLTGTLAGVQRFGFLDEQRRLYLTVHDTCFRRVSGETPFTKMGCCLVAEIRHWFVCLKQSMGAGKGPSPTQPFSGPESARTWHGGAHLPFGGDVRTVSSGYRGMRFNSQNKCSLFLFLVPGLVEGTHLEGRGEFSRRSGRRGTACEQRDQC